jgi:phage gpG-like protein
MASLAVVITPAEWATQLSRTAAVMRRPPDALLRQYQLAMVADARSNFDQSRGPDGRAWRPMAFPRASGGNKPLRDKGLLMASISGGAGSLNRISGNTVIVGTNRPGAALHQFGGTIRPKRAKFLTVPKTRQAARHRARDFPRPLAPIIGRSGRGGVLVDKASGEVQYALTKGPLAIPARPYLGMGRRLMDKLGQIARDWLAAPLTGG